jgi:superoxide dismutase, Cu-Zn family
MEKRKGAWILSSALLVVAAFVWACGQGGSTGEQATTGQQGQQSAESTMGGNTMASQQAIAGEQEATATLEAKSGSNLSGEASFTKKNGGEVDFEIHIEGVSPGLHAVHIHEVGDCSADDGSSAGGHWNPTGEDHGKWGVHPFHLGDIGNIEVGENGQGTLSLTTDLWNLDQNSDHSVLGKAIIVHAGADDFTTQPSGAAGGRIGCGVIALKSNPT